MTPTYKDSISRMNEVTAQYLAKQTNLSARYFQRLASEKKVAWATQPGGPGTAWRFNYDGFREWWDKGRPKQWRQSTKGERSTGGGSHMKARFTDSPLKQRLKQLRRKD